MGNIAICFSKKAVISTVCYKDLAMLHDTYTQKIFYSQEICFLSGPRTLLLCLSMMGLGIQFPQRIPEKNSEGTILHVFVLLLYDVHKLSCSKKIWRKHRKALTSWCFLNHKLQSFFLELHDFFPLSRSFWTSLTNLTSLNKPTIISYLHPPSCILVCIYLDYCFMTLSELKGFLSSNLSSELHW